jgi:hypothetical protein
MSTRLLVRGREFNTHCCAYTTWNTTLEKSHDVREHPNNTRNQHFYIKSPHKEGLEILRVARVADRMYRSVWTTAKVTAINTFTKNLPS